MVIRVEDGKVVLVLGASTGWTFNFSHETGHKAWAELLAADLRRQRDNAAVEAWKVAYERGWGDAKAKRRKATA